MAFYANTMSLYSQMNRTPEDGEHMYLLSKYSITGLECQENENDSSI